jgi:hypothetical protein
VPCPHGCGYVDQPEIRPSILYGLVPQPSVSRKPIVLGDCPNRACCDEWCRDDLIGERPLDAVGDSACPAPLPDRPAPAVPEARRTPVT